MPIAMPPINKTGSLLILGLMYIFIKFILSIFIFYFGDGINEVLHFFCKQNILLQPCTLAHFFCLLNNLFCFNIIQTTQRLDQLFVSEVAEFFYIAVSYFAHGIFFDWMNKLLLPGNGLCWNFFCISKVVFRNIVMHWQHLP